MFLNAPNYRWMSDDMVNTITPQLLHNRPNTYTYTKALVENILMTERGNLPIAIVRPSIVVAALQDPFPVIYSNMKS